mmetsp:Transcript_13325/g.48501  ORF Transcript_13325/g.48501 Transcript_13325/m.48501 type:complete len:126 (+) Transcript_13325:1685-2062(+)
MRGQGSDARRRLGRLWELPKVCERGRGRGRAPGTACVTTAKEGPLSRGRLLANDNALAFVRAALRSAASDLQAVQLRQAGTGVEAAVLDLPKPAAARATALLRLRAGAGSTALAAPGPAVDPRGT